MKGVNFWERGKLLYICERGKLLYICERGKLLYKMGKFCINAFVYM